MDQVVSLPAPADATAATSRIVLPVQGMTCASCVAHVEKALQRVAGVARVAVNLATESAAVEGAALEPEVLARAVNDAGYAVPTQTIRLAIEGMTCASCVARLESALRAVPGVMQVSVNLASESARVEAVAGAVTTHDLLSAVSAAGYSASIETEAIAAPADRSSSLRRDALLALALALPLLLGTISICWDRRGCGRRSVAAATPVQFWWRRCHCGGKGGACRYRQHGSAGFAQRARRMTCRCIPARRNRTRCRAPTSTSGGLGRDRAGAARWLEGAPSIRPRKRSGCSPRCVRRRHRLDEIVVVPVRPCTGDIVIVRGGEPPIDGLTEGRSSVDESMLTGESLPLDKETGALVSAGSINGPGLLEVETRAVGAETMLARIIRLVEDAQSAKAPIQRLVDQVAAVFVPVVLLVAAATAATGSSLVLLEVA
jgi:Cu+-exporting ATPase